MKVFDKVFVVTGGGNGIGRQLVLGLVKRGARVVAVDINDQALKETVSMAGTLGSKISTHIVDITNRQAVEAFAAQMETTYGGVDGLINNAGIIQPFVKLKDLTLAQAEKVMNVNFYGLLYMTKAFLPQLMKKPESHIANVSSMGGFLPVPGQTLYGASKAAVKLMTEGLYSEMLGTNVHVSVIFPGAIGTNIAVNSGVMTSDQAASQDSGKFKMTAPEVAAQIILDGIEKNKFHILVGSDAKMMDFLVRMNPLAATKLIFSQMKSLLQ